MININTKRIGTLCGATFAVLILLSSGSVLPMLAPMKALAFDEEGYIKFVVSKVNGSNGNDKIIKK